MSDTRPAAAERGPADALFTGAGACEVAFYIAYAFRSRLFERMVGGLFARAVERYTGAFEARADAVYGPRTVALSSHK